MIQRRAIFLLSIAVGLIAGSAPVCAQDELNLVYRDDPNLHMVAIEALVVELSEERTRDLGLHYSGNQLLENGTGPGILEGADIVLGRPFLQFVRVPLLVEGTEGTNFIDFDSTRLPGLGISLLGMNIGSAAVSAQLRALLESGDGVIRSRPIGVALNKTPMRIEASDEVPYQDVNAKGGLSVVYDKAGIVMEVTPAIDNLRPGIVTLTIARLEVSSVSSFVTTQNVDRPVITRSVTSTTITLGEGETFIISGLKTRRTVHNVEKVPILGSIWGLKYLFSSQEQSERRMDVLFFITPYILEPGQNFLLPYDFKNDKALSTEIQPIN